MIKFFPVTGKTGVFEQVGYKLLTPIPIDPVTKQPVNVAPNSVRGNISSVDKLP